jgi:hypothetical protein
MSSPITLNSLDTEYYTQKEIQDENVRLGLARCANETKDKSIQKLRNYLLSPKPSVACKIQLDSDMPLDYKYPVGKTKSDLVAHIYAFFNS